MNLRFQNRDSVADPLRWGIKIAAPRGRAGDNWGDTFFANDLAAALRRLGQVVRVDRLGEWKRPVADRDDVTLTLRGLGRFEPIEGKVNLLWVISHPDEVSGEELDSGYDSVFAASRFWADRMGEAGRRVGILLQATAPARFTVRGPKYPKGGLLFVGNTRGVFRPIVRDILAIGADFRVYGQGWSEFIDSRYIVGTRLPNIRLPAAYRGASIVLNDHWGDMARNGFLSNRLFDAVAAGTRVISDAVPDLDDVFGSSVRTYDSADNLRALIDPADPRWPSLEERIRAARNVAELHSFDARAEVLLRTALDAFRGGV